MRHQASTKMNGAVSEEMNPVKLTPTLTQKVCDKFLKNCCVLLDLRLDRVSYFYNKFIVRGS